MSEFIIELYNNKHTPIGLIDNSWVENDKITYKYMDIDEFSLQVPKKLSNGQPNPIYNKIKSGQQLLVTKEDGTQDRFYLTSKKTTAGRKSFEHKGFSCYQFQKKLEGIRIEIEEASYQLSNKIDSTYVSKGLFEIIEENCGYSVVMKDKASAYSNETVDEILDYKFSFGSKNNIANGTVLFDKTVNFTVKQTTNGSMPLYINIIYDGVSVKDNTNGTVSYGTVYNDFDIPFYGNIKRIKCCYNNEAGNRNTLKYTFYYNNGDEEEVIKPFVNALGKTLTFGKDVVIKHTTGNKVKQNVMKYITFDECETSISELINEIQDKYDVMFTYDNINMIMYCYGKENYGKSQPLELSLDSNCFEVGTTEVEDGLLTTSIRVSGQTINEKQVAIDGDNIFGGDIIYCYDYYITNGLLSDKTIQAWKKYQRQLELNQDAWYEMKDRANEINDLVTTYDAEITSLNKKISYWNNLLSTYMVANNPNVNDQKRIANEKTKFENRLSALLLKRTNLKDEYEALFNRMSSYGANNKRENIVDKNGNKIFTKEILEELAEIEKTDVYEDDYFVTNYSLYNYCNDRLKKMVYPTVEFEITTANIKKYLELNKGLFVLGMKHDLDEELQQLLEITEVRLTEIEYNIKSNDYEKLCFSNAYKKTDLLSKVASLGRKSNRSASKLSDYSSVVNSASLSGNFVKTMYREGIDLALSTINSKSTTNILDFNASGCYIYDASDRNKALYLGSSTICFSQDGFKTSQMCINSSGVIAKSLIGQIILGNKLCIEDDNGTFFVGIDPENSNRFGLIIYDKIGTNYRKRIFLGIEKQPNGTYESRLELYSTDGKKLLISDKGLLQTNSTSGYDYVDGSHPCSGYFYADSGINIIDKCLLRFRCGRLRSTTTGSTSGGHTSVPTTAGGGGGTTHNNVAQTSGGGGYYAYNKTYTALHFEDGTTTTGPANQGEVGSHSHNLYLGILTHSHDIEMSFEIPNHTHTIPSHNHQISDHTHTVALDWTHSHTQIYGIYEDNVVASNVSVYVNGTLVRSGLNGNVELDIKNYVKIGQWNEIKFSSATNGCIHWDLFMKSFNLF